VGTGTFGDVNDRSVLHKKEKRLKAPGKPAAPTQKELVAAEEKKQKNYENTFLIVFAILASMMVGIAFTYYIYHKFKQ